MKQDNFFENKVILITGGTGSFGQAFVKRLLSSHNAREIIIFSRDEFKQSEMAKTFSPEKYPIRYFLGDVRDRDRLLRAFNGVDYVVHAAALKQVPALENNPIEAVKTNIIGTQNIIEAALDRSIKHVVAVSTDKAVNPTNLYGATKLVMEKLFIAANSYVRYRDIKFSIVRYGNVIGSRGSVVPYWVELVKKCENELPLTDERMTRFSISLEEGVDLVINALNNAEGGEVLIPKIPSMKLEVLAKAFPGNPTVKHVGIRPGEKLHESLISEDEGRHTYDMGNYYVIVPEFSYYKGIKTVLEKGKKVPDGFYYSSDNNEEWLSCETLKATVDQFFESASREQDPFGKMERR